jgi:hypothetical protein
MRRSWLILAVTPLLVFGWTLTAVYPAAAHTSVAHTRVAHARVAGPGGLISGLSSPLWSRTGTWNTVVSSGNWSGYAATGSGGQFTSVSANWVQPAGHCGAGDQYAAFWVGLDGYTSGTVEQIGSEVDCAGRTASYYGWWEMYPGAAAQFTNLVRPGDHFSSSVTYRGSNVFRLRLTDSTQGWTQTLSEILAGASRSSAEVIAEAPCCTARGGILPLTNFGTVSFTSAKANSAIMATLNPVEITMPDVSVSAMTNAGKFAVSYTGAGLVTRWPFGF